MKSIEYFDNLAAHDMELTASCPKGSVQITQTFQQKVVVLRGCIRRSPKGGFDDVETQHRPIFDCASQGLVILYPEVTLEPDHAVRSRRGGHVAWAWAIKRAGMGTMTKLSHQYQCIFPKKMIR